MTITDLKKLDLTLSATDAAILEGRSPVTLFDAIQNGTHPFGKVYKGKKNNIYVVPTIPLLNWLGIDEETACRRLQEAKEGR